MGKKYGNIPMQFMFLIKFIRLELWITIEKNGTMGKTMVLWKKNDTIPKTIELWFTMEKAMVLWKKPW